jgi:choline kinase
MTPPDVLILAAGRGSRLGDLTSERPKCLVRLGGRPLFDWQLDALAAVGLDRIIVATGYRADAFDPYGLATAHNADWARTNMVATLLSAMPRLRADADLIVCYSDIVYEPRVLQALAGSDHDIATVIDSEWLRLWRLRNEDPLDDAETLRLGSDGAIVEIGGTPATIAEIEGQYIGLTKFSAAGKRGMLAFLDAASAGRVELSRPFAAIHFTELLQGLINTGQPVHAVVTAGGWLEVDTESDLATYEALIANGEMRQIWDRQVLDI